MNIKKVIGLGLIAALVGCCRIVEVKKVCRTVTSKVPFKPMGGTVSISTVQKKPQVTNKKVDAQPIQDLKNGQKSEAKFIASSESSQKQKVNETAKSNQSNLRSNS
jgi:hypothetical protein